MLTQFDFLTIPTVKNSKFQKSKMAAAAILKIGKSPYQSPYLGRGSSDVGEIWHNVEVRRF